ncbi:MAG: tetratricopeptide repeat protein [Myxococcota bacterium]|nr:tetratricopeptide repeat protein [Myxococcota bacterium]
MNHRRYPRPATRSATPGLLLVLVVGCVLGAACNDPAPQRSVTRVAESGDVIDQDLMIALAQAKNFHHKAKVYMTDGNLPEATAAVRQILSLRFPPGAPEADDVRLDARALLAKLLVSQGQLDEAMRTVDEGLAPRPRPSFFVANLHTVQGEIHEARAAQLDGEDQKARAIEERRAAIAAYDRSIQINEALQQKLMEDR